MAGWGLVRRCWRAMHRAMSGDATETTLRRIALALDRIEAVAARPAPASSAADGAAFAQLSQRHQALVAETKAALADLDTLIADVGGAG